LQPIELITRNVDDETSFSKPFLKELGGFGFILNDQNSHGVVS
jgi:hypothetical protein